LADGIDLLLVDEAQDLHDFFGGRRDFLNFVFFDQDVLVLFVLVAFDDLRALDEAVVVGAERRLLDAGEALLMELVKGGVLGAGRRVEADGDRNQTKGQHALPDRRGHGETSLRARAIASQNPSFLDAGGAKRRVPTIPKSPYEKRPSNGVIPKSH
jgi:hypothetical protein